MRQDVWAEVVATAETLKRNKLRRRSIVFRGKEEREKKRDRDRENVKCTGRNR